MYARRYEPVFLLPFLQTNEASKLGADKHREMAVFEVALIANGLAAETGAGKAICLATTNVTLLYRDGKYMNGNAESLRSSVARSSKRAQDVQS